MHVSFGMLKIFLISRGNQYTCTLVEVPVPPLNIYEYIEKNVRESDVLSHVDLQCAYGEIDPQTVV